MKYYQFIIGPKCSHKYPLAIYKRLSPGTYEVIGHTKHATNRFKLDLPIGYIRTDRRDSDFKEIDYFQVFE